jgi:hypothetical protein
MHHWKVVWKNGLVKGQMSRWTKIAQAHGARAEAVRAVGERLGLELVTLTERSSQHLAWVHPGLPQWFRGPGKGELIPDGG